MIQFIARHWLERGAKYRFSRWLYRSTWSIPIADALRERGISLEGCCNPHDVAAMIRGRAWHEDDPLWGLVDIVRPPAALLRRALTRGRGGDCDCMAMLHAQAIALALPTWEVRIVSYLSKPFWFSHHFAVARAPEGRWWVVQPQPAIWQEPDIQIARGGFASIEDVIRYVSDGYRLPRPPWWAFWRRGLEEVAWYDVRRPDWSQV